MLVLTNQKGAGEIEEVAERKADHQPDIFRSVLTIFLQYFGQIQDIFRSVLANICKYFGQIKDTCTIRLIHLTCGRC